MKKAVVGILAHVDAGKTTLAESILYTTGAIRSQGRVDTGNTALDNHLLEKERGITIFSSEAIIKTENLKIFLVDTPGHVDFSAETERTLQILDYAVLVISGTEGIQSHTITLWRLLEMYNIPVFIFVTKMDYSSLSVDAIISELKEQLSFCCVNFNEDDTTKLSEAMAECNEKLLEKYFSGEEINDEMISDEINSRRLFPVFFGSGLKNQGVEAFINGLEKYISERQYPDEFSARVYKITHDSKGAKEVHVKITGGNLKVRDSVYVNGENVKVSQIRMYNGIKYVQVDEIYSGEICTLIGIENAENGKDIGVKADCYSAYLEPVMRYSIILPDDYDADMAMIKFRKLEEEDPSLQIRWNEHLKEIQVSLMGEIQAEILKSLIYDKFQIDVKIQNGKILYKETIKNKVEGVGHYEPLRHYAEVHLILEPLPRGKGVVIENIVKQDSLDINWQRLIEIHLYEKRHLGVLTGSELTDVKISIAAGRAHLKHTEGGDFRQATYRAVRHGLMNAENILLEPYYYFRLNIPSEYIGRAIVDIQQMYGTFETKSNDGVTAVVEGKVPAVCINGYGSILSSYTSGKGRIMLTPAGYYECHNSDEIIKELSYDPEGDLDNSPDSVFCAHGSGFPVKWDKVSDYMHIESCIKKEAPVVPVVNKRNFHIDDKELEAIMEKEFGKVKTVLRKERKEQIKTEDSDFNLDIRPECIIVDGYNVIFAWDALKSIASYNLEEARSKLLDILSNYSAYSNKRTVVVFDAYKVSGNSGKKFEYGNIHVVFTKENELADVYIEKLVSEIGKNEKVKVVTSDNLIQLSAIRFGVLRMSAADFEDEISKCKKSIGNYVEDLKNTTPSNKIADVIT